MISRLLLCSAMALLLVSIMTWHVKFAHTLHLQAPSSRVIVGSKPLYRYSEALTVGTLTGRGAYRNRYSIRNIVHPANINVMSQPEAQVAPLTESNANATTFGVTKREAYAAAKASPVQMPVIILVNPFLDQNVGSCARAMLNFGFTEMRVVAPRCDILSDQSRALAAGAFEILENAKVYETLQECIADLNRIMATTIRPRDMTQLVYTPRKAAEVAVTGDGNVKVGIMFGRERNGLSNEEIAVADSIITIQSFKQFSSLNLAQAVNIVAYEMHNQALELQYRNSHPSENTEHQSVVRDDAPTLDPTAGSASDRRFAKRIELESYFQRLEDQLDKQGYQLNARRREICFANIRNIYQRAVMTKNEVDTLQGVLTALSSPSKLGSLTTEKAQQEDPFSKK